MNEPDLVTPGVMIFVVVVLMCTMMYIEYIRRRLRHIYRKTDEMCNTLGLKQIDFLRSDKVFMAFSTIQMLKRIESRIEGVITARR